MNFIEQLEDLFHQYVQLPENEQKAFCQTVESENPELYDDFIKLVEAMGEADEVFEKAVISPKLNPLKGLTRFLAACAMEEELRKPIPIPESIAGFEILRPLGSGGMGIVYHARQNHPFKRDVALKVIRPGLHDSLFHQHLEIERQALALMNHDGIARIYNSGTTQDDRIYFTMEYVNGPHIIDYCKEQQIPLKERLELYIKVCDAVEYAHRQGILHGDLKPSNMLIAITHDAPQTKIIDFGIARACNDVAAQLFKESRQANLGTPAYMSPEQNSGQFDIRSDIYALGAVLTELIHVPDQYTKPQKLQEQTEGELRWILDKVLAKDPDERYATVKDFRADLQNYIKSRPLSIGPKSASYRVKHWIRRNRILAIAITAVSIALTTTAAVSTHSYIKDQQVKARMFEMLKENQETHTFYLDVFSQAHPDFSGRDVKFVDVLKVWEDSLKDYAKENLGLEGRIRLTLGETYRGIGLYEEAHGQHTRALELFEQLYGQGDARTQAAKVRVAQVLYELDRYEQAVSLLEAVQSWDQDNQGLDPADLVLSHLTLVAIFIDTDAFENAQTQFDILDLLANEKPKGFENYRFDVMEARANFHFKKGDWEEGYQLQQQILEAQITLFGKDHHRVLLTQQNIAGTLRRHRDYQEAEVLYRKVASARAFLLGEDHPYTLKSRHGLVICLYRQKKFEEAAPLAQAVYQHQLNKLGQAHRDTRSTQNTLANMLASMGEYERAFQVFEAIIEVNGQEGKTETLAHARTLNNYGDALAKAGQVESAFPRINEAIDIKRGLLGNHHLSLIISEVTLAEAFMKAGELDRACPIFQRAVSTVETHHGKRTDRLARYNVHWGNCLLEQGKTSAAEAPLLRSYELAKVDGEDWLAAKAALFKLYMATGKKEKAQSFR